jgi:hypothetical protein
LRLAREVREDGEKEELPARFHILITDGVQSTKQQVSVHSCVAGSDYVCVKKAIAGLLDKGWGGCVIGLRSEFHGKVYSELDHGKAIPYESKRSDSKTYRPFYLYLLSPDRAALDKLVEALKARLRTIVKPEEALRVWSNGGHSQNNPLNSAEVVAALAALDFFAGAGASSPQSYTIGASSSGLDSQRRLLGQLPKYRVGPAGDEVDPEKVFLATAVAHHLLVRQIPWADRAKAWNSIEGLRALYADDEVKKEADRGAYFEAARLIAVSMQKLLDPQATLGWNGEDAHQFWNFLSADPRAVKEVGGRMAKKFMSKEAKGEQTLDQSSLKVSTFEFGEWCPPGD